MKKQIFIAVVICSLCNFVLLPTSLLAQTKTSTPSATISVKDAALNAEVDKLKEKVAKKVSKMKGDQDKAIAGIVSTVSDRVIKLTLLDGSSAEVALDDTLTQYRLVQGTAIRDTKKDALKKGDYVFAVGPLISGTLQANAVYKDEHYLVFSGKITEANAADYTVKVVTQDKLSYVLDIQSKTKQEMLNIKTLETEKIGFSKLKEGDSIHVVVKANFENPKATRFDAERILIVPNEYFLQ